VVVEKTLLAQLSLVVIRPLVFVWGVATISTTPGYEPLLFAVGFLPAFSILDVVGQSVARHRFLHGALRNRSTGLNACFAAALIAVLLLALFLLVERNHSSYLSALVVLVYSFAAYMNVFERSFSSADAIFDLCRTELFGYFLCFLFLILYSPISAAVYSLFMFPLARILTASARRSSASSVATQSSVATGRVAFVGSAVAAQMLAALAGMVPVLMVGLSLLRTDLLGTALIYFKLILSASAVFSLLVNLYGPRIFYGHMSLDLGRLRPMIRNAETALVSLLVVGVGWVVSNGFVEIAILACLVCLAFSYLNLVSSLALARARPDLAAAAQFVVLVGSIAFALFLGEVPLFSTVALVLFGSLTAVLVTQGLVSRFVSP
jgi:hypothetical protein